MFPFELVKLIFSQICRFSIDLSVKNGYGSCSRSNVKWTLLMITKIVKQKSGVHRLVKNRQYVINDYFIIKRLLQVTWSRLLTDYEIAGYIRLVIFRKK